MNTRLLESSEECLILVSQADKAYLFKDIYLPDRWLSKLAKL